jgi:hypothetical protein
MSFLTRAFMSAIVCMLSIPLWFSNIEAAQYIIKNLKYSNDKIVENGQTTTCVVTLAAFFNNSTEILNFQFLAFKATLAWKVTGGIFDLPHQTASLIPVVSAKFVGVPVIDEKFFDVTIQEAQLVAYLNDADYAGQFTTSFFAGNYSVDVSWQDTWGKRTYLVAEGPPDSVASEFQDCLTGLRG